MKSRSKILDIDLRYLHLYKKCPYLLKKIQKKNKAYFVLRNKLQLLINFFLYKKIREHNVNFDAMLNRWNKIVPKNLKYTKYNKQFKSYLENFYDLYKKESMDIICIYNPIVYRVFDLEVQGHMDLITKERKHYNVYNFYLDTDSFSGIPGIIGHMFKEEFGNDNVNYIAQDIKTGKKKTVHLKNKINKYIKASLNVLNNISYQACVYGDTCKKCSSKGICEYGKS